VTFAATVAALGLGVAVAFADVTYVPWNYYAVNYGASDNFEGGSTWWWWTNYQVRNTSEPQQGTVTFIKTDGGWSYTAIYGNATIVGSNIPYPSFAYYKKPYCKNSGAAAYWFRCAAAKKTL
jgi:hypothetical protein